MVAVVAAVAGKWEEAGCAGRGRARGAGDRGGLPACLPACHRSVQGDDRPLLDSEDPP